LAGGRWRQCRLWVPNGYHRDPLRPVWCRTGVPGPGDTCGRLATPGGSAARHSRPRRWTRSIPTVEHLIERAKIQRLEDFAGLDMDPDGMYVNGTYYTTWHSGPVMPWGYFIDWLTDERNRIAQDVAHPETTPCTPGDPMHEGQDTPCDTGLMTGKPQLRNVQEASLRPCSVDSLLGVQTARKGGGALSAPYRAIRSFIPGRRDMDILMDDNSRLSSAPRARTRRQDRDFSARHGISGPTGYAGSEQLHAQ